MLEMLEMLDVSDWQRVGWSFEVKFTTKLSAMVTKYVSKSGLK